MIIEDLEHLDPIAEEINPEGGFFFSFFPRTSPRAFAFTNSSVQAIGSNFALVGSTNIAHALSTPFFSFAFASSTSIAIAG